MASPKRTPTQREADLERTAALDRRGYTQLEIAAELKVSRQQIQYDLKIIRRRYAEAQIGEIAANLAEKLAQFRELRREAWWAWEESKKDKEVAELSGEPDANGTLGRPSKSKLKREGRLPAYQYLRIIRDCLVEEKRIVETLTNLLLERGGSIVRAKVEASIETDDREMMAGLVRLLGIELPKTVEGEVADGGAMGPANPTAQ